MAGALGGVGALAGGSLLSPWTELQLDSQNFLVGLSPLWKLLPGDETEALHICQPAPQVCLSQDRGPLPRLPVCTTYTRVF